MAKLNSFLVIEPKLHYLEYGSCVLREVVRANRRSGQTIIELVGEEANAENVKNKIRTSDAGTVVGVGHGNVNVYTVECTEILVRSENVEQLSLFKDRIVQLNSCLTAQVLGPALIEAGVVAYVGSREPFWLYVAEEACASRAVRSTFLAEYEFVASLLRGATVGQARADQLQRYEEEINYWLTGEGKNHPHAAEVMRILELNLDVSIFLGEEGASATTPRVMVSAVPALLVGFAFVGAVLYKGLTS
ncbi:hypothetical protein ES702_00752 [subsurface metagenome]